MPELARRYEGLRINHLQRFSHNMSPRQGMAAGADAIDRGLKALPSILSRNIPVSISAVRRFIRSQKADATTLLISATDLVSEHSSLKVSVLFDPL